MLEINKKMQNLNNNIFHFFYNLSHKSVFIDWLIVFVAHTLPYLVIVFAFLYLLTHKEIVNSKNLSAQAGPFEPIRRKWTETVFVFSSGIIAWCVATLLKFVFQANRPYLTLRDVEPLISKTDYSFPSGHATFFMALAVAMYLSHKKAGYIFIVLALLIGLARIAAGVHYPVDIIGGFILGGLVAYSASFLYNKKYNK